MRKRIYSLFMAMAMLAIGHAQSYENQFSKPLSTVLKEISERFGVKLKYDADTSSKTVPFADFRIRPYSVDESLSNVLGLFDFKPVPQEDGSYKIKSYEYPRRTADDGKKMLAYLQTLYTDSVSWNARKACLHKEIREKLGIDELMSKAVKSTPVFSKLRKYNGYGVQNFYLETVPGLYVCGSVYMPLTKGKHPLILSPNGHWGNGRYNEDLQLRKATLARMGAVVVDYDLFGWGESEWQVSASAHRTSMAHTIQIMNGLLLLDYMLTRKDIDSKRVGVNGGSGGGSQVVLLTALDNRFTAASPVVSLASHFDGGCPCESGMPVSLACGGTNNAEMMAMFAPKPLLVVSDGKDWTASVPELEYPYLQEIYSFYKAKNNVSNVHLPLEGHTFGISKRNPVYDFFATNFSLNAKMVDESKVTVEPREAMTSFGLKGEKMPANAIRSLSELEKVIDKKADRQAKSNAELEMKAKTWVAELQLKDDARETRVINVINAHLKAVRDWHNNHPYQTFVPQGINPLTGKPLSNIDREVIANSAQPRIIHEKLMTGLRKDLTEEQVEFILDKYTIGKVAFTLAGYKAIVPDLTATEEEYIVGQLKLAREQAVDYKSMKAISAIFEIYKSNCEQYLNQNGRDWRQLYRDYVNKRKAEKEAEKKE